MDDGGKQLRACDAKEIAGVVQRQMAVNNATECSHSRPLSPAKAAIQIAHFSYLSVRRITIPDVSDGALKSRNLAGFGLSTDSSPLMTNREGKNHERSTATARHPARQSRRGFSDKP
ncbi:hypothetical protein PROAA_210036 [Candidatus Propionivibrio aalborgensis]|uniref:Uncharacterized protein n=1 Tax=Candidatus Propionivibrio aalborgensis TaxID=1860101 RepID=A0A1A8XT81_9RHOO|nr:hypothetical protein PROAA_210036 [Candidatus Propionivibrio aalborgensis]